MKIRSFLGVAAAAIIILTYSVQTPSLAYQPGEAEIYEAKDGRNIDQSKRKKDQDKKDEEEKKDQNKKDNKHNNQNDTQNDDQKNQNKDDKKHHNDHNQHQDNDQNNQHHDNHDQNHDNDQNNQHHDNNDQHQNNDQHHENDQNHNNQHHDNDQHNNNHHDSWHDDDPNPVLIIGLLLFQQAHERSESRRVLQRTAAVLERAQAMARQDSWDLHHRYGLGRAFSHQRWAQNLFRSGNYQEAAFHSLKARDIALRYIHRMEYQEDRQGDGYWRDDDYYEDDELDRNEFDDAEVAYWERCPGDSEMTIELDKWYISDDEALNIRIEMNF